MPKSKDDRTYFPILISLADRPCLMVGGGPIARFKVEGLAKFSPQLTIIAPQIEEKLAEIAQQNGFEIRRKKFEPADLKGFEIVIAATGNKSLSKQIWQECHQRKILVNTVDDPQYCDFILPATVKRGDLTVSVGTQGKAPFLTKEIRRWLNRMFTPEWSDVVELAADFRKKVFAKYGAKEKEERNACFARFLEVDWAALLREKKVEELDELIDGILEGRQLKLERTEEDE